MSMNKEQLAQLAYFSGLIYGWASRIKDGTNDDLDKLKKDMIEESKRIAELAGVNVE